ncbi:N-lysine methyltransferase KMT5A-like [Ranitomeya imitator]|uniref:N-lysine methyltransferase KMT5A-like n=1 Tax=Ranitomeya imitator TaxID=111125 RepID=UPI0037E86FCB
MAMSAYKRWADEMPEDTRSSTDNYVYYGDLKPQLFTSDLVEGMKKLMEMKETSGNVAKRVRTSSEGPSRENQSDKGESSSSSEEREGPRSFLFRRLTDMCPVGINTSPPSINQCKEVNPKHAKFLRNKWIDIQKRLRAEDAAKSFWKLPRRKQLANYVKGQGWKTNIPTIQEVAHAWKPKMRRKKDLTEEIKELVRTQTWKGLVITEDSSKGGHTVKTTHAFKKGQVVCDYHGETMDSTEGEALQRSLTGISYMYFFTHKGHKMCINASKAPCDCHPDIPSTFGRMINHSGKVHNIKPKVQDCGEGETPTILFYAERDLKPGTELLFDYGVRRNDFGDGADCSWLDA